MRVLGVDPGLTRCGVGVVDGAARPAADLVAVGVVRHGRRRRHRRPAARARARRSTAWLAEHRPDAVAVERVFSQHNVRTVMGTAQASAVAIAGGGAAPGCRSPCTRPARSRRRSPATAAPTRRR